MKCTSCGLPISPTHTPTNCPRCGTPTDPASPPKQPQYQYAYWEPSDVVDAGGALPNYQRAQDVQSPPLHSSPPQSGQMWSAQVYQPGNPSHATPPNSSRNTKLGFILAGLCIVAGSLILIFVYFLAVGLQGSNSSNSASLTSTPIVSTFTPTKGPTATAVPSQTATTYPGQHFIDNARMSAALDPNSLQPSQITTTFQTGQKIYVSFQVHPNGHAGAVCIIWYLQSKQITNFSIPVSATSRYSYAYAIYGGSGPAHVELYWASNTQCSDQVLAQHVDFAVKN